MIKREIKVPELEIEAEIEIGKRSPGKTQGEKTDQDQGTEPLRQE